MAQRRSGNSHTTISITWEDKDEFRRYARKVKTTKNGDMFESDAVLFKRMFDFYRDESQSKVADKPEPTYPNRMSLDVPLQDSESEEPNEQ